MQFNQETENNTNNRGTDPAYNAAPADRKKKKKIRSYPIIVLSLFYVVLFGTLMVYVGRYSYTHKKELFSNSYNTRQQILTKQNSRGKILARDGEVLAYNTKDVDGNDVRVYPYGKEFAHAVGYSTNGKAGIEAQMNYYLVNSNVDLKEKVQYDKNGEKYPGDNVITTLDVKLQEVAYNALSSRKGAVVVSDPRTGEILAMVSKPDFDPNLIAREWNSMIADTSSNARLLNRATQGKYPPGSTFKIVTSLAYLKDHPEDYGNYRFNCSGKFTYEGSTISCFHGETHGSVDFISSFAKSCNTSFSNMGLGISPKSYRKTLNDLMFNDELPLDMAYSKSSAKYENGITSDDIMQLSIGQGATGVSPVHINLITNAIANKGVLMKPYLVKEVKSEDDKVILSVHDESYKRLMSAKESEILTEMMEQVVQNGTATKLKGLSYTAAGKTGSAEFNSATSDSHAWFTGFAPAENPEISVTIIVEDAGSGGSYAVPIAKRIFDAYFGVE